MSYAVPVGRLRRDVSTDGSASKIEIHQQLQFRHRLLGDCNGLFGSPSDRIVRE